MLPQTQQTQVGERDAIPLTQFLRNSANNQETLKQTESAEQNTDEQQIDEEKQEENDMTDLFREIAEIGDTPEKTEVDTTIIQETENEEDSSESTNDGDLVLVTSEDEARSQVDNTSHPASGSTSTLRKKFENRTFTEAEFFGARSPNKRSRDEQSPTDKPKGQRRKAKK